MCINGYSPLTGVQARPAARRSGTAGGSFAPHDADDDAPASAAVAGGGAIGGLDALLALQSVDDPLTGRKRAARRGHDLLDALEQLKADLLAGRVSMDRLERLTAKVKLREPSDDPALEDLIDQIELRAQVELAKLGRYLD